MGDVIRNRQHAAQLKVFEGMRWGSVSPTDIDAFLEFQDRLFIFIETKHADALPQGGQRLALERLCDACCVGDRVAVVLVASHDSVGDILFPDLPVTFYRYKRRWRRPKEKMTLYDAVSKFREIVLFADRKRA